MPIFGPDCPNAPPRFPKFMNPLPLLLPDPMFIGLLRFGMFCRFLRFMFYYMLFAFKFGMFAWLKGGIMLP
jgi:hypothetical protein